MNTTTTETRYLSRKDCLCGAGRTSAVLVGRNVAANKTLGPVFIGETFSMFNDVCVACRGCGLHRGADPVRGKVSHKHLCGSKCLSSKGPSCECSCGGKNHGASYSAVA